MSKPIRRGAFDVQFRIEPDNDPGRTPTVYLRISDVNGAQIDWPVETYDLSIEEGRAIYGCRVAAGDSKGGRSMTTTVIWFEGELCTGGLQEVIDTIHECTDFLPAVSCWTTDEPWVFGKNRTLKDLQGLELEV